MMTRQIITTTRFWLIGLALFLAGTASHAAVTLEGNTAVGITALDIGLPDLYNVTFHRVVGSVSNPIELVPCVPGTPCDLFGGSPGDMSGAETAANAIQTALKDAGADSIGLPGGGYSDTSYMVPYDDTCTDQGDPCIDVWDTFYNFPIWLNPQDTLIFKDTADVMFARFQPTSQVPLPPAAYLFASGLALLGWMRRRRAA